MTNEPTATKVLDGFLAARTAAGMQTSTRMREVVGWFHAYVEAQRPEPIDDLTAYRFTHAHRWAPSEYELAAVLAVLECVPAFFAGLLSAPSPRHQDLADTADMLIELGAWLVDRHLVDADVASSLDRFARELGVDHQRTGT